MTRIAATRQADAVPPVAPPAPIVERCAATGITKPECHCPACLAELVAHHHRPAMRS